jgi:3-phosphoshikimate 1-carboxyvinyltransferase
MRRVIAPLARMGARIDSAEGGLPPLRIHANDDLHAIDFESEVASAQVKSAVLLAGLRARGTTRVREPQPTRDYTERMLAAFGWPIRHGPGWAELEGGHRLQAGTVQVPADFSSAAFLLVAASVVPGASLTLRAVGLNPRRTGLLHALRAMGADIRTGPLREAGGEPVADLHVRHAPLHGIEVDTAWVPDMIDEFPALFVAAACAEGETMVRGAAELRVKESDRLTTMTRGLQTLGVAVEEYQDGARIRGGRLHGGTVDSHGDHRIAMAFAVAAQRADGPVVVQDVANVATSFPGFEAICAAAGMPIGA